MKILVTGGIGFIGSHTCVELLNDNHQIVVIDNLSNCSIDAVDKIKQITGKDFTFIECDIRDEALLEKIFTENDFDCVIHFAGLKAVGESVRMPLEYFDNNVGGTVTLLEVMKRHNVKRIIFSSSATVYGSPATLPITEEFPLGPVTNPYGRTKLMIEEILKDLWVSDNSWSIILLRYFNPIGAHSSGLLCESPKGTPNNIMPRILNVALKITPYITVFGNDYDTPDGTGVRDYIHVTDLALGHVAALKFLMENNKVEAFNLGTGTGYSVFDLIHTFIKVNGVEIPYSIEARRPGDIAACYADPDKALRILGWKTTRNLETMCIDGYKAAVNCLKRN
ncbi:MAG: UDP-glucose 4-epimerase GalE [Ruminococcaceae bacterium]|nr:UDP-glucose 4-epimerase GalE [Oscillospiraceae bacterium]